MNISAVGAHPDDIEMYCGGTMRKYKESGHNITFIIATNGEIGSPFKDNTQEVISRKETTEVRYEEAKKSAYVSQDGKNLIIPPLILYASLLNASSFHKIQRRSAKSILAGSIRIEPQEVILLDENDKPLKAEDYIIDVRPVVIQRARVLKSRARIDKWKAKFTIIYNEKLIADKQIIQTVLEEAGMRVGIMDFRPNRSGFYGTFKVNKFE